jgi:hypothetical protein
VAGAKTSAQTRRRKRAKGAWLRGSDHVAEALVRELAELIRTGRATRPEDAEEILQGDWEASQIRGAWREAERQARDAGERQETTAGTAQSPEAGESTPPASRRALIAERVRARAVAKNKPTEGQLAVLRDLGEWIFPDWSRAEAGKAVKCALAFERGKQGEQLPPKSAARLVLAVRRWKGRLASELAPGWRAGRKKDWHDELCRRETALMRRAASGGIAVPSEKRRRS